MSTKNSKPLTENEKNVLIALWRWPFISGLFHTHVAHAGDVPLVWGRSFVCHKYLKYVISDRTLWQWLGLKTKIPKTVGRIFSSLYERGLVKRFTSNEGTKFQQNFCRLNNKGIIVARICEISAINNNEILPWETHLNQEPYLKSFYKTRFKEYYNFYIEKYRKLMKETDAIPE